MAVTGENAVAVVDTGSLEVEKQLRAGEEHMGLIVLERVGRTGWRQPS